MIILTNGSAKTCSSFLSVRLVNSENNVLRTYSPGVTSVNSDCRSTQDSHGKTSFDEVPIPSCVAMSTSVSHLK